MKIIDNILKLINKLINFSTTILFIILLCFGAYALYDMSKIYDNAKISGEILALKPSEEEFSLSGLQEINPDICGWIRIYDTNMDYPVVKGKDNSEYLNIDYKKEFSTAGSIFLDYRNDRDISNDYSIIYGHNMDKELMFSDIKKYEDEEYFNSHLGGMIFTETGIYDIEVFSYAKISAYEKKGYNLITYKNNQTLSIISYFKEMSLYINENLEINSGDKLLLLSTCDTVGSNDRAVLLVKLKLRDANIEKLENVTTESLDKIDREKAEFERVDEVELMKFPEEKDPSIKFHLSIKELSYILILTIITLLFIAFIIKLIRRKIKIVVKEYDGTIRPLDLNSTKLLDKGKEEKKTPRKRSTSTTKKKTSNRKSTANKNAKKSSKNDKVIGKHLK